VLRCGRRDPLHEPLDRACGHGGAAIDLLDFGEHVLHDVDLAEMHCRCRANEVVGNRVGTHWKQRARDRS
jgi:hypothetical protein